jgi:hypothetical protein
MKEISSKHTGVNTLQFMFTISMNIKNYTYLESEDQSIQVVSSKEPWKTRSIINGLNSPEYSPGALKTKTEMNVHDA